MEGQIKKTEPLLLALPLSKGDQVLGGGCNWGIADMRIYHNISEGFKSADMLEKSKYMVEPVLALPSIQLELTDHKIFPIIFWGR